MHGTNGVSTIEDAGSLPAFSTPEEASAEVGTNILNSGWDNIGDITTMFDSSGQEIVIGYANNIESFIAAPIDDLTNPVTLTTTLPASFDTTLSPTTLGAAWTHSLTGSSYFSSNNGQGVWALYSASVDIGEGTATLSSTEITESTTTNSNDGFGCAGEVPQTFEPEVTVTTTCSADYEGTYEVKVNNLSSTVIASVVIEVNGSPSSTILVSAGGTLDTNEITLANDSTVSATVTNDDFAGISISDTASLSNCAHVVDPQITITLACSGTYEGSAEYTIDNTASTLDVAVSYFIDDVETTQSALAAGGTIGVIDIPINNGSTITVTATADGYPPVSVSDSLTGCVAPDVFVPTAIVETSCSDGTGSYLATVDNTASNVDATMTITIDGVAVGDPVTVAAGQTQDLTGSVADGQEVVVNAGHTNHSDVSDSETFPGCPQVAEVQAFVPALSILTSCSADGSGSYTAIVDNAFSDMDVNVVVAIDGVDGDPIVVVLGGTETLTGDIDNDSTVTVTASAGDDSTSVSATLTDCIPPPPTTTTEPIDLPSTGLSNESYSRSLQLALWSALFGLGVGGLAIATRRKL